MSTMTKVFVVLVAVLALALSVLTVGTAARWSNQKEMIDGYQQLYQSEFVRRLNMEAVLAVTQAMHDDAIKEKESLLAKKQDEVRQLTDDLAARNLDLARETNDRVAAEAGQKKLIEILGVQTAEVTAVRKQNQDLLLDNIDYQTRIQRLSSRVLELTSEVTIKTDENRNLQEKLYAQEQRNKELQQTVASGRRTVQLVDAPAGVVPALPQVAGPIEGEVVEVEGRYVSINVGESSGVVAGMEFMVRRGSSYVGDLRVETVRPKEAGGKLTMLAPGQAVQRGDQVVFGMN